ncbi:MAG: c-type cytochrome domain-containing protein [Verrucomicrobiota bacterium]
MGDVFFLLANWQGVLEGVRYLPFGLILGVIVLEWSARQEGSNRELQAGIRTLLLTAIVCSLLSAILVALGDGEGTSFMAVLWGCLTLICALTALFKHRCVQRNLVQLPSTDNRRRARKRKMENMSWVLTYHFAILVTLLSIIGVLYQEGRPTESNPPSVSSSADDVPGDDSALLVDLARPQVRPTPDVASQAAKNRLVERKEEPVPAKASAPEKVGMGDDEAAPQEPERDQEGDGMVATMEPVEKAPPLVKDAGSLEPAPVKPVVAKRTAPGAKPRALGARSPFNRHIVPILKKHCYSCHDSKKQKGDLRLDSPEWIRKGGASGMVVVPGDPKTSSLYYLTLLPPDDPDIMPAKGKALVKKETEMLRKWIQAGADMGDGIPFPGGGKPRSATRAPVVMSGDGQTLLEELEAQRVNVRNLGTAEAPAFEIDFSHADFPDGQAGLARLGPIANKVHTLDLTRTPVEDGDLKDLSPCARLRVLQLNRTSVSDAGLVHLGALAELQSLNLYGTKVTDEGLRHLAGLKRLQKLYLWQTKVTKSGAAKLKKALPGVTVNMGE